jgi:hypothetical protein
MKISEYRKLARSTAIYPNLGNNPYYPALGLSGEASEFIGVLQFILKADESEQITPKFMEMFKKEAGDVLWYITNLAEEFDLNPYYYFRDDLTFSIFQSYFVNENIDSTDLSLLVTQRVFYLIIAVGKVSEMIKKLMRDGKESFSELNFLHNLLFIAVSIAVICAALGVDLGDVATLNVNKLQSRKERGVLKGSGDDR